MHLTQVCHTYITYDTRGESSGRQSANPLLHTFLCCIYITPPPSHTLPSPPGLLFVAYCVLCYLVTALLFSLLVLDLAALLLAVVPAKGLFKAADLVYTGACVCVCVCQWGGWGVCCC